MPTPEYTQENLLKKVHIGNTDYYFKDEDLRNFVESFGTAVEKDAVSVLDDTGTDLPTETAVADYVDDIKTNYIDPKASVALGNDEELIFNYVPVSPTPSNTYTITFDTSDQTVGNYFVHITSSLEPLHITPGNTLTEVIEDDGEWQTYAELPSVEFTVRDGNGDEVSSDNIGQNGWKTESGDYVYGGTIPEGNLTIYPNLYDQNSIIAG